MKEIVLPEGTVPGSTAAQDFIASKMAPVFDGPLS